MNHSRPAPPPSTAKSAGLSLRDSYRLLRQLPLSDKSDAEVEAISDQVANLGCERQIQALVTRLEQAAASQPPKSL